MHHKISSKKGLTIFGPLIALAFLGMIVTIGLIFNNQPPITEQELGILQATILKNIAEAETELYYHEQLAHQTNTEALYELATTAGLPDTLLRICDRGDRIYTYNHECKPQETLQETFLKHFITIHEQKLGTEENTPEYTYTIEEREEHYELIALAQEAQQEYFHNNPQQETIIGPPLKKEQTYPECTPQTQPSDCYNNYIQKSATKYGIDPALIKIIIKIESNFDPTAESERQAKGLMQVTPIALKDLQSDVFSGKYCKEQGLDQRILTEQNLLNPEANIEIGTCYYAFLYQFFEYNHEKALIAYNQGPGDVLANAELTPETQRYKTAILTEYREKQTQPLTLITGKATQISEETENTRISGILSIDYSFQIPLRENFAAYDLIYQTVLEKGNCLLGETPETCLTNEEGFTWTVEMKEGYPLITVITNTNDPLRPERENITLTFYADPNWLQNPNP